ncbi:dihydroneopterin aldolase [Dysgonomonas sp. 521]|uniref:dihydroneopterin aldolase n=1 Tax=Dysgonomonas sp. 521 TaxID=2302932 RepID=UPI0013D72A44|nr:dihydroneopterin aldolase [Dysgonomonas sp. 521]NDV95969.1 dihydroneopterin aldolase [Dysgonomonas sp. 521]
MKSFILLENMVFYAYHGVLPQEAKVGNEFVVNLKIEVDLAVAAQSDILDDTISYAAVYEEVKKQMAIPSRLLENVAYRIIQSLRREFTSIEHIEVKLSKRNPPMGAQIDYASVVLTD